MKVNIHCYSIIKERVGQSQVTLDLQTPATVRDLLDELVRLYPAVTPSLYTVIITVNREFVDRSHQLNAEDEIALFSPVSGG
ncbi:MAG TPA: hypothetical protein DDW19_08070 [Anaerolineaceae bacterium]|jgi:MoaD family protein|nr:hypothetical protein [Anaerolineaceae bacterium]